MLKRKDKILISAIELFEKWGVNGLTTKNLAQTQGISEPALYRQYKNKQQIINAIIEEFSSYDENIINTIIESKLTGKEAMLFYINRYAELYQNYSGFATILISLDLYYYNDETRKRMKEIIDKRNNFLSLIISKGEQNFYETSLFTPDELAKTINNMLFALVYEWYMEGKSYDLKERILSFSLKLFIDHKGD
ncbi:MAG: TetR/AcrR family transcriptional regulator [Clostridia bacterium]|nr:TetR/AcrR family transcriptional regulator [Clostridia bacterium]